MIEYTINMVEVTEGQAYSVFSARYFLAGYACWDEMNTIWNARGTSETARDLIFEISGYTLEIFTEEE